MKQKYYGRADGKLYECVFRDSCRTKNAGTFDCLRIGVRGAGIFAVLVYNG